MEEIKKILLLLFIHTVDYVKVLPIFSSGKQTHTRLVDQFSFADCGGQVPSLLLRH